MLVDGRLYGLGEDGLSPRCLLEDVISTDIEWGPVGDRVRVGDEVVTDSARLGLFGVTSLEWTSPTGSRIVGVSPGRLWKLDLQDATEIDITFLEETDQVSYHPAGLHLLAVGTSFDGQYGMWLATNQGTEPSLLAFDEGATLSEPAWTWLGEPLFVANHSNEGWHLHRVELTSDGALEGPVLVESETNIDMLKPSSHDPVMLAYRVGGVQGESCVEGSHVAVRSVDLPEPLSTITSAPVGWLSTERLLVLAYPDGCDSPADLWTFSAGLCPGSVYGASMIISGVDGAAARQPDPPPPPPPDFTGIIDPAPA